MIKNQFLGTAMHDLRSPLSSISGFSDLFLRGETSYTDDEKKEFVKMISQASKDLLGLVHDLLDISFFESGQLNLNLCSGNLNSLLLKQIQINQIPSSQKNINITTSLEEVPDSIFDPNRMGQVMDNLISNAIKFSPPGTSIQVGLTCNDESLEFISRIKFLAFLKKTGVGCSRHFPVLTCIRPLVKKAPV